MELMPDDVLLEVMQYLGIVDLLACRLVCRRLGALAMLPEVWRHQRFEIVLFDDVPRYSECSVLRLAPCVREWRVWVPLEKCHTLYATTRCAVRKLTLWLNEVDGRSVLQASLLIRNQAALGRLRSLCLSNYKSHAQAVMDAGDAAVLLGTVASTSRLETLKLTGFRRYPPSLLASLHRSFSGASLKSFKHDPQTPEEEPFCDLILSTHAATLESVDLGYYPLTSRSTATLLAGAPNLRSLQCGMMPGLEAVARSCVQLRNLDICVAYDGEAHATAEFLRRATQLVKVTIQYEGPAGMAPSSDLDFVLSLAATGHSRLEELSLHLENWEQEVFPEQQHLLKALPGLPALKHLELYGVATNDLLLGITPANAPALRTLKVFEVGVRCAHDASHCGAVQELLSMNPELNFSTYVESYCCKGDRCAWCALGCHQDVGTEDDDGWVTIPRL